MGRHKIKNLAEHYLSNVPFKEAPSADRNRFLDEVVRRYAREATKKYPPNESYALFYSTEKKSEHGAIARAEISVVKFFPWSSVKYHASDGRLSRVGEGDKVGVACLSCKCFALSMSYSFSGALVKFCVESVREEEVTDRLELETEITKIEAEDEEGFNYELPGFVRLLDRKEYASLRTVTIPSLTGSAHFGAFVNKLTPIIGVDLLNEITPDYYIINSPKIIEKQ